VVTDAGPAHALPDFVAKVRVEATPEMLADVVAELLADPDRRSAQAAEGLVYVAARGFDRGARDLLGVLDLAPTPAGASGPAPR
jgi:hypothetical protein